MPGTEQRLQDAWTNIVATRAPLANIILSHREKKGYSGVTTYASEAWAPLSAESDCLGSGEDDIDREGRCGFSWFVAQLGLHVACAAAAWGRGRTTLIERAGGHMRACGSILLSQLPTGAISWECSAHAWVAGSSHTLRGSVRFDRCAWISAAASPLTRPCRIVVTDHGAFVLVRRAACRRCRICKGCCACAHGECQTHACIPADHMRCPYHSSSPAPLPTMRLPPTTPLLLPPALPQINVYVPNAGDRPARARLPYKLRFLEASDLHGSAAGCKQLAEACSSCLLYTLQFGEARTACLG